MSDYVTLLGAEQVQSAGARMASAADDMQRAASSISESVERLIRALDEHASRVENSMRYRDELEKDPTGFSAEMVLDEANNWTRRETGKEMLLNYGSILKAREERS